MFEKAKPVSDAFTFSLCGATTVASFAVVPVIALDRVNKMLDERFRQVDDAHDLESRELPADYRAAA